jgi:hypothetical protein
MSESKPADDASLRVKILPKMESPPAPGLAGKEPAYGPGGSRCKGGMNSAQALVRNVRTLLWMRRKMTNGKHHEEEYRCQSEGRSCS